MGHDSPEHLAEALRLLGNQLLASPRNQRAVNGVKYLVAGLRCLRWLGEACAQDSAMEISCRRWELSDQSGLADVLRDLDDGLASWSDEASRASPSMGQQLLAMRLHLGHLRLAFFGDLKDDAYVIRGGHTHPEQLRRGVDEHRAVPGLRGFSVNAENGLSVEELALAAGYPNGQISWTQVSRLRRAGTNVIPSPGKAYHCTVIASVADATHLSAAFQQMPNPHRRRS